MNFKSNWFLIVFTVLLFAGCRYEPPADSEVEKRFKQYFQSVNLPYEIEEIIVVPKQFRKPHYVVEISVRGKIYSGDRKVLSFKNKYSSKFIHATYGYWFGSFELIRKPPSDSVIYQTCSEYFSVEQPAVNIVKTGSFDEEGKFYPVTVFLKLKDSDSTFTLPFSQDEFGIWKIGINDLITPESTVKTFLNEVNKGNTDYARRYYSYNYKSGYDEIDKKNLENLFSKGSIKDVRVTDVFTENDTSWLDLAVVKNDSGIFKTDLELIRYGIEWRIKYDGWNWKFKPEQ